MTEPLPPSPPPVLPYASGPPERPALWNPRAAAAWSLLFSPIFGALIHAANWRMLGDAVRARRNVGWAIGSGVFILFALATAALPESKLLDQVFRFGGIGLLVGWLMSVGNEQNHYVKNSLPHGYDKRPWGRPLSLALGALVVLFGLAIALAIVFDTSRATPAELAAGMKPLILAEWQKKPILKDATIQDVQLRHAGGDEYVGHVDATIVGNPTRLDLKVVNDGKTIRWEIKVPDKPAPGTVWKE
jgi:hypothetical protein